MIWFKNSPNQKTYLCVAIFSLQPTPSIERPNLAYAELAISMMLYLKMWISVDFSKDKARCSVSPALPDACG